MDLVSRRTDTDAEWVLDIVSHRSSRESPFSILTIFPILSVKGVPWDIEEGKL
jgi:hypothetical protein